MPPAEILDSKQWNAIGDLGIGLRFSRNRRILPTDVDDRQQTHDVRSTRYGRMIQWHGSGVRFSEGRRQESSGSHFSTFDEKIYFGWCRAGAVEL